MTRCYIKPAEPKNIYMKNTQKYTKMRKIRKILAQNTLIHFWHNSRFSCISQRSVGHERIEALPTRPNNQYSASLSPLTNLSSLPYTPHFHAATPTVRLKRLAVQTRLICVIKTQNRLTMRDNINKNKSQHRNNNNNKMC